MVSGLLRLSSDYFERTSGLIEAEEGLDAVPDMPEAFKAQREIVTIGTRHARHHGPTIIVQEETIPFIE